MNSRTNSSRPCTSPDSRHPRSYGNPLPQARKRPRVFRSIGLQPHAMCGHKSERSARTCFVPRSVPVEQNQTVSMSVDEGPQEIVPLKQTPRISMHVSVNLIRHGSDRQGLRTTQQTPQGELHVAVSHQGNRIRIPRIHPRTSPANRTPRLVSPLQSRGLGCSDPRIMSVAPLGVFEKHSTWEGSAMLRITGEWVASSTWAS